jgi:hypothetical protein
MVPQKAGGAKKAARLLRLKIRMDTLNNYCKTRKQKNNHKK